MPDNSSLPRDKLNLILRFIQLPETYSFVCALWFPKTATFWNCLAVRFAQFTSPVRRVRRLWVTTRLELRESIGRDRVRLSRSLHSGETRRKSLPGWGKERRRGQGAELSFRAARAAFRKDIRDGQTHCADFACARRKTHGKNRITASALARNIKNIWRGSARSVEWGNKVGNALARRVLSTHRLSAMKYEAQPRIARWSRAENRFWDLFLRNNTI